MTEDKNATGSFALQCDAITHVFSLINSISNAKKDQYALICANSKGLRISVENASKSMHAASYLNVSLHRMGTDALTARCNCAVLTNDESYVCLQKDMFAHYDVALVRGEFTEVSVPHASRAVDVSI
jgi:hypothetical protein